VPPAGLGPGRLGHRSRPEPARPRVRLGHDRRRQRPDVGHPGPVPSYRAC
jgi:hypothetical protein